MTKIESARGCTSKEDKRLKRVDKGPKYAFEKV